jgi:hypothetical protein
MLGLAEPAPPLLTLTTPGMAGGPTVNGGGVVIFLALVNVLVFAIRRLDGEDGVRLAVRSFERIDDADAVADRLPFRALTRVSVTPACSDKLLLGADGTLHSLVSTQL